MASWKVGRPAVGLWVPATLKAMVSCLRGGGSGSRVRNFFFLWFRKRVEEKSCGGTVGKVR